MAGRLGPSVILSYALFFGTALLLVAALPTLGTLAGLSFGSYALLTMLAVVHTTLAFALYTFGLGRLGAGAGRHRRHGGAGGGGALGAALLGEELTVPKVVGGALVISRRGAGPGQAPEEWFSERTGAPVSVRDSPSQGLFLTFLRQSGYYVASRTPTDGSGGRLRARGRLP